MARDFGYRTLYLKISNVWLCHYRTTLDKHEIIVSLGARCNDGMNE